ERHRENRVHPVPPSVGCRRDWCACMQRGHASLDGEEAWAELRVGMTPRRQYVAVVHERAVRRSRALERVAEQDVKLGQRAVIRFRLDWSGERRAQQRDGVTRLVSREQNFCQLQIHATVSIHRINERMAELAGGIVWLAARGKQESARVVIQHVVSRKTAPRFPGSEGVD